MLGHSWKRFARAFIEEDIYSGIPRKRCLRTHESGGMHEQSFLDVRLLQISFRRMFGTNKLPGTPLSCARIEVDSAGRLNKATYRRTGKAVERTHRTCESPNTKTDSHRFKKRQTQHPFRDTLLRSRQWAVARVRRMQPSSVFPASYSTHVGFELLQTPNKTM